MNNPRAKANGARDGGPSRAEGDVRVLITLIRGACLAVALASGGAAQEPAHKTFLGVAKDARDAGFEGIALIGDRNGPVISAAAGKAAPKRDHHIDDVWPWASATRQVTAVLVMQEVERGRLSLDQTIVSALPAFKGATGGEATIRELLQHMSGLPNPESSPKSADFGAPAFYLRDPAPKRQAADALGFCAGAPAARPGARVDDNACDYIVLGAILEALNGASYADLIRTRIAEPLALRSLRVAPRKRSKKRDVVGHVGATVSPPFNEAAFGAGGALFGSAEDLLAFDRALLDGRLLGEAALKTLWTGDPALGYAALGALSYPARLGGCAQKVTLVERRGAIGGVQVRNIIAPDKQRMLVLLANEGGFDFGEIARGTGWSYEFSSAAFCRDEQ